MRTITFKKFNENNPYTQYFIELKENTYVFTLRWSEYSDCAFLDITDFDNTPIITGRALVNGLTIRNHKLPYVFIFTHKNVKTYEPTLDILSDEFVLAYIDEEEEA